MLQFFEFRQEFLPVALLIAAVVLGAVTGTLLNIDGAINSLAERVEKRFKRE